MHKLIDVDHQLSAKIRTWGKSHYGFWKFIAARSIALFVLAAVVLAAVDRLRLIDFILIFIAAYVIALFLQLLVKRQRPDFETLTGYKLAVRTYSYPSAHAAMSAAAATSLCLLTAWPNSLMAGLVITGAVLLAGLIGISRVVIGVHYGADVVFGWLTGFMVAYAYVLWL
ncbi:MAG: phosphatase PAP2 family protein [Patescibacteria group bacterium]